MSDPISYIQLTWTDLSSITRCLVVTNAMFQRLLDNKASHGFFDAVLTYPYPDDMTHVLDAATVFFKPNTVPRPLTWFPKGHVSFGTFVYDNGEPCPLCPRSFLIKREKSLCELGIQMIVGFELEFFLLNPDGSPADNTVYGETKALRGEAWSILTEVVETLIRDFNIPVWRFHAESIEGQFEMTLGPFRTTLVEAADSVVLTREAISHIAAKYGKQGTFVPKPFSDRISSGSHIHISLERKSRNLFEENSKEGDGFLAGIFQNVPNLMLIFAPTGNSYERIQPSTCCGAFHCMGTENKEAPIRLIRDTYGHLKRFELKTPDGTSNPYLVLGSLIGAGLHGISNKVKLPEEVTRNPAHLPIEKQPPRLPKTLSEAIDVFRNNEFNRTLFGDVLRDTIVKVRSTENDFWESMNKSRREKLKMLLSRY